MLAPRGISASDFQGVCLADSKRRPNGGPALE